MSIKIFFCYAREDGAFLEKLQSHLRPLQRKGLIDVWYDRNISAGAEWKLEISAQLNISHIILLFISPDFLNSDYCYSIEMKRALERHERGEASVLPIILRHCAWQEEPFSKLQVLPTDARPLKSWLDPDEAFFNVAEGIRKTVKAQLITLGDTYYEARRYEEALAAMEQSVQLDPSNAQQYKRIGDVCLKMGKNEKAIRAFDKVVALNPRHAVAYSKMAWTLNQLEEYEKALKASEKAIDLESGNAFNYQNKGIALYSLKIYEESLEAFDQAILLEPTSSSSYRDKGYALLALNRYDKALAAFEQAIELEPGVSGLYSAKATALHKLDCHNEALAAFEQALNLDPQSIQACEGKDEILQELAYMGETVGFLEQAEVTGKYPYSVEVKIKEVQINPTTEMSIVLLQTIEQRSCLSLPITLAEAAVIAHQLQGTASPGLPGYALFNEILAASGVSVIRAILYDFVRGARAYLMVKIADKDMEFEASPSDAILMALYSNAPIYVRKNTLEVYGVKPEDR